MPDQAKLFESALKKALKGSWKQAIVAGLFCAVPPWISTQLVGVESTEQVLTIGVVGAATFLVGAAIFGIILLKFLQLPNIGPNASSAADRRDVLGLVALVPLGLGLGLFAVGLAGELTRSVLMFGGQGWAIFGQALGVTWMLRVFCVQLGKLEKEIGLR